MRDSFKPISDFASIRRGASPRPIGDPAYFGGNVGWVKISDVTSSKKFLNKTKLYLSKLGESKSLKVDKGDLVMSICGTIGRPIIINMSACIHDGFVQLYDIKNADIEYLYYVLQYSEKGLERKGQPGTQVNLNTTIVGDYKIFAPPLPQQKKIAEILSTCDTVIAQTEAAIAKYEALKQGLMHDLFTRGIDVNTGKLRPTYQEAPELYKETELGWIPREWEVCKLNRLGEFKNGLNKDKGSFGSGTPFVNISDAYPEVLQLDRLGKVQVNELEKNIYRLEKGDIIFTRSSVKPSGVGYTTLYNGSVNAVVYSGFMIRYRINNKEINSGQYFNHYFRWQGFRRRLLSVSTVSANTNVNQLSLGGLLSIKPVIGEQKEINNRLKSIIKKIFTEQQILDKYTQLKAGLMQDLLSGAVGVEELVEE